MSRGLKAALVEQDDIAAGTLTLVPADPRRAALPRAVPRRARPRGAHRARRLLHLAPHLVRIEPLLFPIYGIPFVKAFYDIGLTLYDVLAHGIGGCARHLSIDETLELAPTLRADGCAAGS